MEPLPDWIGKGAVVHVQGGSDAVSCAVPEYRECHSAVPEYRECHSAVPEYRDCHSAVPEYRLPV